MFINYLSLSRVISRGCTDKLKNCDILWKAYRVGWGIKTPLKGNRKWERIILVNIVHVV